MNCDLRMRLRKCISFISIWPLCLLLVQIFYIYFDFKHIFPAGTFNKECQHSLFDNWCYRLTTVFSLKCDQKGKKREKGSDLTCSVNCHDVFGKQVKT